MDLGVARIAPLVPHYALRSCPTGGPRSGAPFGERARVFARHLGCGAASPSEQRGRLRHSNILKSGSLFFAHLLLVNLFTPRPSNKLLEKIGLKPDASTARVPCRAFASLRLGGARLGKKGFCQIWVFESHVDCRPPAPRGREQGRRGREQLRGADHTCLLVLRVHLSSWCSLSLMFIV